MPETERGINVAIVQHNSQQSRIVGEMLKRLREPSDNTFYTETLSTSLELLTTYHTDLVLLDPDLLESRDLDALTISQRVPPAPNSIVAKRRPLLVG